MAIRTSLAGRSDANKRSLDASSNRPFTHRYVQLNEPSRSGEIVSGAGSEHRRDHARFFSLDVHGARGVLLYGRKDEAAAGGFRGRVTCMETDGSRAVFGGVIRRPATPQPLFFLFYVVDTAPPGVATRDLVSLLHVFDRGHPDAPVPPAFPYVCPSETTSPDGCLALEGDIAVR